MFSILITTLFKIYEGEIMNIDDVILLAATARANELIKQIESGERSYEAVMAELSGSGNS